jgi:hypothetical protein
MSPISSLTLNPGGTPDGDLPPALAIGSGTGMPMAVWAEWDGNDYELAFSWFDGNLWSPPERLTDNSVDDTEPSIASRETGSAAIAWRSDPGVPRIQYRQREVSGAWSPIIDVSSGTQSAAHPVVLSGSDRVRVAFVEDGSKSSKIVKVAGGTEHPDPWPSVFEPEIIAITYWDGDLAPGLFSSASGPVSLWTDSPTVVGYSRFNGANWTPPAFEPYAGAADLEAARIRAKQRALHGP